MEKEGRQHEKELAWMTRHALRTLTKQGHSSALLLQGYIDNHEIRVIDFSLDPASLVLTRGEVLRMSCEIKVAGGCQVMLDYVIDFAKANGTQKPKVFKWKKLVLKAGESVTCTKNHHFKADATTFTLYPGVHTVTLQINGRKGKAIVFDVR